MTCGRKIGNFDCCSVVCGDCLELLKFVQDSEFVRNCAIVTDPPYGIDYCSGANSSNSISSTGKRFTIKIAGDNVPFDPSPFLRFGAVAFTGAQHFYHRLPAFGALHTWDKRGEYKPLDQSDADIIWCSRWENSRTFYCVWRGLCRHVEHTEPILHPTQKPIELMAWMIELCGGSPTILDPFCGSGTTLVAAKKLGRHFLGFEIEEFYVRIARERLARVDAQPSLFQQKPEQLGLIPAGEVQPSVSGVPSRDTSYKPQSSYPESAPLSNSENNEQGECDAR